MLRVAVIGAGNMGKHHIRNYSEMPTSELVAISDTNTERKELAEKYGCKFYTSYIEMLENEDIDAVSVVVPSKLHHEVSLEVINRGKHLLVEKPIAETVKEAESIINAAKEKKVKLMIGHLERFNPVIRKVKEIIDSGSLGEVVSIIARRVGGYPQNIKEDNVLTDLAVHDIDIFNYLLGKEPKSVHCHNANAMNSSRTNTAEILINYGGTGCVSQVNWITPVKVRSIALTGTLGYLEIDNIKQELKLYTNGKFGPDFESYEEFLKTSTSTQIEEIKIDKEEPLRNELESFINSISNDTKPLITGEDGLKALRIAINALNGGDKNVYS